MPPSVPGSKRTAGDAADFGGSRRLDIQGLRAVAVLMVVAFHAGLPVPGGFVGVDVFFVISGFVITAMLHREWTATGRINLGQFYLRRFKRLTPALALVVAVTMLASALALSPLGTQQTAAKTGAGALLLAANFVIARTTGGYFDAPAETNPLLNAWSLSVEEQFYLFFPTAIAIGWFLGRTARHLRSASFCIVALVAFASFGLAVLGPAGYETPTSSYLIGFYGPAARAWEFAVGALLALALTRVTVGSRTLAFMLGLLGLGLVLASLWVVTGAMLFPGPWTLLPVAGTLMLLLAGTVRSNPVTQALAFRPMVKIGDWSYAIYLWHWPLVVFAALLWPHAPAAVPAAALLSVVPAVLSYRLIEQPLRVMTGLSVRRTAFLVLTVVGVPLMLSGGLAEAARTWLWHPGLAETMPASILRPTGWGNPRCISRVPLSMRDTTGCQWYSDAPGVPIYLVGDSNAQHFSDGMIAAAGTLQRPLTTLANDGCPLVDAYLSLASEPSLRSRCREGYESLMRWLEEHPPGLVVIGSVSRYWRDSDDYVVSGTAEVSDADPRKNVDVLDDGLLRTVRRLQAVGDRVLLLQTIPHYLDDQYQPKGGSCSGWDVIRNACHGVYAEMPLEAADAWQSASREGIAEVARKTGAKVFDFRNFFCENGTCRTRVGQVDFYMPDGYHLNRLGSLMLAETLAAAIRSAG